MDNQEDILDALRDFEKKPALDIPPLLDEYLGRVASTGETLFPWPNMKPLFVKKLDGVMQQFQEETHMDSLPPSPNVENVKFDAMRERILNAIDRFHGAPFTIQRLCELITNPKKHYKRADKFLRGVEKNILVVSTVDPFGRKVVSESKHMVNGLDSNGHMMGQRDSVHGEVTVSGSISATKSPSSDSNWSSEGVTSSSTNSEDSREEDKTQDMHCSDSSGEITTKGVIAPEPSSATTSDSENPKSPQRLQEQSVEQESREATDLGGSEQAEVTSEDNQFTNQKEIQPSEAELDDRQNQPLVFASSHITSLSEAKTESTVKDDVSDTETDKKLTDEASIVSSVEDIDKPTIASEEMSDDVDSSSTVLPQKDDRCSAESPVSENETGSGDDAQKTEEPSSSDGEESLGSRGAGDCSLSEGVSDDAEEGISSSESPPLSGSSQDQPTDPKSPPEQGPPDDTAPSQSSSSETDTVKPSPDIADETSSEAAVTCPPCTESDAEISKSDITESPESSSRSLSPSINQPDITDSESVSSSSESSGVAMETDDTAAKISDFPQATSNTSSTENFCSTSDISEAQTEEPMEED